MYTAGSKETGVCVWEKSVRAKVCVRMRLCDSSANRLEVVNIHNCRVHTKKLDHVVCIVFITWIIFVIDVMIVISCFVIQGEIMSLEQR